MGKTLTAAQMLSAGRKRPPTPAETGTERLDDQSNPSFDDQATKRPSNETADHSSPVAFGATATTRPLDDQTSKRLSDVVTSAVDDQASKPPSDQASKRLSDVTTSAVDDQATKPLVAQSRSTDQMTATYQRVTVFLTPAQREWLKLMAKQLPDGLSVSDMVRLAVSRLSQDVTGGLDLIDHLTEQAHSDAEVFSGRRNRGLPPRVVDSDS